MKKYVPSNRDFCVQKIDSAISLARRLLDGEYPHRDSNLAIQRILQVYEKDREELMSLDATIQEDTVLEFCRRTTANIDRLKLYLGMLIRSANLRNAFEQYFPIKILATELVGEGTRLVFSSEWKFSPFTYPIPVPELPEFVFIGIPASECQNPLIMPLAGHELGHVIWRRQGAYKEFEVNILRTILQRYEENWDEFTKLFGPNDKSAISSDLFIRSKWVESFKICQRQLEEVFCDYVGFYIFGPSFLYSFRYLIAPGFKRNHFYPSIRDRVAYIVYLANIYNVSGFDDYTDGFDEEDTEMSPQGKFILKMADLATRALYVELPALVEKHCEGAEKFDTGSAEEYPIETCFRALVPAASVKSMAAVVNAAWKLRLDLDGWNILTNIQDVDHRRKEKLRVLADLVLKSFEVFEYRKRVF